MQRVDWQLLTFDWPSSATQVQVFVTPQGSPVGDLGVPRAQLSRAVYEAQGGLRLSRVLPDEGCDLHIVPASFFGGQIVRGAAVTITYRGISRLWYRITVESSMKGRFFGGGTKRLVEIYTDRQLPADSRLILVHNDRRLPLDANDGQQVFIAAATVAPGQWAALERFAAKPGDGYFRMFAAPDPLASGNVAVLDPPLVSLRGSQ
jgi:hypothetical protein